MDIIKELRRIRRTQEISQQQLGDKIGMKQQYIYQIESKKISPTITTINKILKELGYELNIVPRKE